MTLSRQDALLLAALAAGALVLAWLTGSAGWSVAISLAAWSIIQWREKHRLIRWARRPLRRPDTSFGSWEQIPTTLQRTLQRARARNRTTVERLRALRVITDSLPDAAIIVSTAGEIEDLNRAAMELLRLKATDRGHSLAGLIRQPDFLRLLRGQLSEELVEFKSPYNEAQRLEARRVQIDERRMLILVRNVTELNRLLTMRQDFVANVSHELRTPLTVIVGYIETLLTEPDLDRATVSGLLDKLRSPVNRMRALVDDLLLLSRLEASPIPAEDELCPIEMASLLNAVATDALALSEGRHQISVEVPSTAQLLGIENELHSACANLVTNAVRYSPDGGNINVRWDDLPDGGGEFSVTDEGMGIPPEHLSRITERFYRVDLAKSRVRGGTGLGLAIVKHVLKRHGSELRIESQLAKGSRFYCVFDQAHLQRGSLEPPLADQAPA